ncbi:MAG TPA: RHS repeat-associated core domain-containing protein [Bacteroidetes bacterium]|nr:RHS repeat-associated core domain-containing protein [Bacteroidota bacterium]
MFADINGDGTIQLDDPDTPANESELLQENHYYPFGMNMVGGWTAQVGEKNQYQYNGKELDEDLGLGWMHYGARMYDPAIGRFTGVDPIADKFAGLSVYNYASNSPIRYIDLHGLQTAYGDFYLTAAERSALESGDTGNLTELYENGAKAGAAGAVVSTGGGAFVRAIFWALSNPVYAAEAAPVIGGFIWGLGTDQDAPGRFDDYGRITRLSAKELASIEGTGPFNNIELGIIDEVHSILGSREFSAGLDDMAQGISSEAIIDGRKILFEADGPFSGFSLFGENGFVIGREALGSQEELTKTLLHELHRLNTSNSSQGVSQELLSGETMDAFQFAEKAFEKEF